MAFKKELDCIDAISTLNTQRLRITTVSRSCHGGVTHTGSQNDVLDEYPSAPVGVCCTTLLMSLSVSDPEVSISFYTDKNLLQNLSLSTCIKPTGEERLFSNCFSLAAELPWFWVNPYSILGLWLVIGSFRPIIYTSPRTVPDYSEFFFSLGDSMPLTENEPCINGTIPI